MTVNNIDKRIIKIDIIYNYYCTVKHNYYFIIINDYHEQ